MTRRYPTLPDTTRRYRVPVLTMTRRYRVPVLTELMPNQLVIRAATEVDTQFITDVINLAFGDAEKFFIDSDRITHEEVVESMRVGKFLVASVGEEMLGCVYIEPRGLRAYLGLLSVDPRRQAQGIGSRLMTLAEEHCRNLGCKFMDIKTVSLRTELVGYYEKRGYLAVGTTPFPSDVETKLPCHFVDMTKMLS